MQVRFGNLITNDPDYQRAKRSRTMAFILILIGAPLGFIVRPLMSVLIALLTGS